MELMDFVIPALLIIIITSGIGLFISNRRNPVPKTRQYISIDNVISEEKYVKIKNYDTTQVCLEIGSRPQKCIGRTCLNFNTNDNNEHICTFYKLIFTNDDQHN